MATKTVGEQAVARVGKRPVSATTLATKLGLKGHQAIARPLGEAVKRGELVKTDKGYSRA